MACASSAVLCTMGAGDGPGPGTVYGCGREGLGHTIAEVWGMPRPLEMCACCAMSMGCAQWSSPSGRLRGLGLAARLAVAELLSRKGEGLPRGQRLQSQFNWDGGEGATSEALRLHRVSRNDVRWGSKSLRSPASRSRSTRRETHSAQMLFHGIPSAKRPLWSPAPLQHVFSPPSRLRTRH